MFKRILFAFATIATAVTADQIFTEDEIQQIHKFLLEATPQPGSLATSLKRSSLNNVLRFATGPIASALFEDTTIAIDTHINLPFGALNIDFNDLYIRRINGPKGSLNWKSKTSNTLVLALSNIDLSVDLDGGISLLGGLYGFEFDALILENLSFTIEISINSPDGVMWAIEIAPKWSLDDFVLTVNNYFVQSMIEAHHEKLLNYANFVFGIIGGELQARVEHINSKVANQGKFTWLSPIISPELPLNITMTKAPFFDVTNDLIELHLDGKFFDIVSQSGFPIENEEWQDRQDKQKNQFFFHETMLNSLALDLFDESMIRTGNPLITDQVLSIFREFRNYFGNDVEMEVGIKLESIDLEPFHFKNEPGRGIQLGDGNGGTNAVLTFFCKNETMEEFFPALRLRSDIEMYFDFEVQSKFIWRFLIQEATFTNTHVVEALIPMAYHPYDALFDAIMDDISYNWNYTH